MDDALTTDPDDLPLAQRRYLVDRARANLRARGVEQSPSLYQLYERYAQGGLTRRQLEAELATLHANRPGKVPAGAMQQGSTLAGRVRDPGL